MQTQHPDGSPWPGARAPSNGGALGLKAGLALALGLWTIDGFATQTSNAFEVRVSLQQKPIVPPPPNPVPPGLGGGSGNGAGNGLCVNTTSAIISVPAPPSFVRPAHWLIFHPVAAQVRRFQCMAVRFAMSHRCSGTATGSTALTILKAPVPSRRGAGSIWRIANILN